jgi:AraC-like DNA-binding protein
MHRPPRPILVMHSSPTLTATLREAAGEGVRVQAVDGWEALERTLARLPATAVVFVDPYFGSTGGALADELKRLLAALRTATVVAAFRVTESSSDDLDRLADWGVADVVDLGREDTPESLRRRLRLVRGRLAGRLLERALPRWTPTRARALLAVAAEVAAEGGGSGDFAAMLGVTERTVLRWCARADLPDTRRLLTWMRVLIAGDLLDDPGRTLQQVAHACGYSSDAALRNAVRGLLGAPPRALRGRAFAAASEAFSKELFALRDAAHAAGRTEKRWLH